MMAEECDNFPPYDKNKPPLYVFFRNARHAMKLDELGLEIAQIALPASLALTADPIASLVDTAFIGHIGTSFSLFILKFLHFAMASSLLLLGISHLINAFTSTGPVELAAVGVAIALFNQISRIAIFPLVSITTSFVAEEDTVNKINQEAQELGECLESSDVENKELPPKTEAKELLPKNYSGESEYKASTYEYTKSGNKRRHIPSASSALVVGSILGILEAIILIAGAKPLLDFMGIGADSAMLTPAQQYLTLRSLGAPAVLLSLAMQGVFRGFKDTKTPLYATLSGDLANIILDPMFIFVFRLGVSGAAIAHVISQYLIAGILLWRLIEQVDLIPPSVKHLQFGRFLKNGFLLLIRVMAVTFCVTLSASLAARQGPTCMAAFQVCLQVWLATSLLADGLAVAGQAILASSFAKKDYTRATETAARVLQLGLILGCILSIALAVGLTYGKVLFSRDADVLHLISIGIPFVAGTQPLNSLAFVFDGVNFGASDFKYAAYSMLTVAIFSILCLLFLSTTGGFIGLWVALTIYMSLRAFAGFWRIGTGTGPWEFLRR